MRTDSPANLSPFSKRSSLSWSMLTTFVSITRAMLSPSMSSINFPEHDIHRADDRDHVGDHVALGHLVHGRQVREARRADLHAPRLVGAVGDQVDAELALRVLDRGVHLAGMHVEALGEALEVVDQLLHRGHILLAS